MKKPKKFLQKVAAVSGILSFLLAIACGVWLHLHVPKTGGSKPDLIPESLGATILFFISTGMVLIFMGRADLPDLSTRSKS